MPWPNDEQPFGVNHAPLLSGLASDGSGVEVPVAVDKDTGELLVSGGGSGGGDVNLTQIDGNTASVGNGTTDTGTLRVTISSDSTGQVKLATGANTIGAISNTSFAATQSGTWAVGSNSAVGSGVPSAAFYLGMQNSAGNLAGAMDIEQAADGSNGIGTLGVAERVYNGTNYDRVRSGGVTGMIGVSFQASPSGAWSFTNIATSTTTTVKTGAGTLHLCSVNTLGTVSSTATFYDNTAGSGTIIAIINTLSLSGTFTYDIAFTTGLTVVTTGTVAPNITVAYK